MLSDALLNLKREACIGFYTSNRAFSSHWMFTGERAYSESFIIRLRRKPFITFPRHCLGRPSFHMATPNQSPAWRDAIDHSAPSEKRLFRPCLYHRPALIWDADWRGITAGPPTKSPNNRPCRQSWRMPDRRPAAKPAHLVRSAAGSAAASRRPIPW